MGELMGPLSGKRVVVTRPAGQAASLARLLVERGAVPIACPAIQIAPMPSHAALDAALARLATYDWVVFTSANGVRAVWERLSPEQSETLAGRRVAAIGPATAQALARHGVTPAFVPAEYVAEAIVPGLGEVRGQRVLLPRAELAREALAQQLSALGADVHEIAAYRTVPAQPGAAALAELRAGVDAVTFTSSSTVAFFSRLLATQGIGLGRAAVACIGPITAGTAREAGWPVDVVAAVYTAAGLVEALELYFARERDEVRHDG
jgi:uroporphyrinogen-III synthase